MAYISYDKFWRSEFYKNVSAKVKAQYMNFDQLKMKANNQNKKAEKKTNFKPQNNN